MWVSELGDSECQRKEASQVFVSLVLAKTLCIAIVYVFGPLTAPSSFTDTWTRILFKFYVHGFDKTFFLTRAIQSHPINRFTREVS